MAKAASLKNRRSLSQGKAKEILADKGFKRLGGGFDSAKQRRYIGWVAGGSKSRKMAKRKEY